MSAQLAFPVIAANQSAEPAATRQTFKDLVLAQFKAEEPVITALASKYRGVAFDCTTTKGLDSAKSARLELREQGRFKLQRAADATKKEANDLKRLIDSESERLIGLIKPVEDEVDQQIQAEEQRKAAEKAERERKAAELKVHHDGKIATIRACADRARGLPSERIANGIAQVEGLAFGQDCGDFLPQYEAAKAETLTAMRALLAEAQAREAAEAQRLENERVAAELAAQKQALKDQAADLLRQRVAVTHAAVFAFPEPEPEQAPAVVAEPPQQTAAEELAAAQASTEGADLSPAAQALNEQQGAERFAKAHPAVAKAFAPAPAGEPATLTLGTICKRLGGLTMTAAFVADVLGVHHSATDKAAKLYRESDFGLICDALAIHAKTCKTQAPEAVEA